MRTNVQNFIRSLQQRPYEERVKFLWIGSIVCAVLLIVLWIGIGKLAQTSGSWTDNALLAGVRAQLNTAMSKFPNLTGVKLPPTPQVAAGLPEGFEVVQIRSFSLNEQHQLVINFLASNPTDDILTFLDAGRSNIHMQDLEQRIAPISVKSGEFPYPSKILSKTGYPGQLIFPQPNHAQVSLVFEGLSMQGHPEILFSQSITIDLEHPASAGSVDVTKPRE